MAELHFHSWNEGIWSIEDLVDKANQYFTYVTSKGEIFKGADAGMNAYHMALPLHAGAYLMDDTCVALCPERDLGYYQLDNFWSKAPNFAFVALEADKSPERPDHWNSYHLLLAEKINKLPVTVRPLGSGYPYLVNHTHFWANRKRSSLAHYFTVDTESRMWPCAELMRRQHPYHRRSSKGRRVKDGKGGYITGNFTETYWGLNKFWTESRETPECMTLSEATAMMMNFVISADNHWNLRVEKKTGKFQRRPIAANLVINETLVKRLFKDRDKIEYVMTKGGKRRPILHWARAHHRKIYDNPRNWAEALLWRLFPRFRRIRKVANVKTHLRGLRQFHMKGLECEIVLPGLHRTALLDWKIRSDWFDEPAPDLEGDEAFESQLYDGPFEKDKYYIHAQTQEESSLKEKTSSVAR